jgi:hypothetical protein
MATTSTNKPAPNRPLRDLALLFSVPIAIALLAAAFVYVPRLMANPQYDFVYAACPDYACRDSYSVSAGGTITRDPEPVNPTYYDTTARLYYYDAAKDSSRSLTLEEARRYQLDTSSKSPDGYTLTREDSDSGFLFWSSSKEGWYLAAGLKKKEILLSEAYNYSRETKFLGWVKK